MFNVHSVFVVSYPFVINNFADINGRLGVLSEIPLLLE